MRCSGGIHRWEGCLRIWRLVALQLVWALCLWYSPMADAFSVRSMRIRTTLDFSSIQGREFLLPEFWRTKGELKATSQKEDTGRSAEEQPTVREVLSFLAKRYANHSSKSDGDPWTKTRSYLYRTKGKLTMDQIRTVVRFLDRTVPPATSAQILRTNPRILRKPVGSFLKPTASFLKEIWGEELFLEAVTRNPNLLLSSGVGYTQQTDGADGRIESLLRRTAGISATRVASLKKSAPFVFGLPEEKVEDVLTYLEGILQHMPTASSATKKRQPGRPKGAGKDTQKILSKIISAYPYLLNLKVESNLKPRIQFLQSACGMDDADVAKLIKSSGGSILGLSVEDNLGPTLEYLAHVLNIHHDTTAERTDLRKCLLSHPQLLALSMPNLRSKVDYFGSLERGASRRRKSGTLAARILLRCPTIYSLSLKENIVPTVEFLAKVWGFHSPDSTIMTKSNGDVDKGPSHYETCLVDQIQDYPNVLTLSLEGNIQPTINFFNRTGYTVLNENWELVPGHPRIRGRYIAASLYSRLLPRWHFFLTTRSEGTNVDVSDEGKEPDQAARVPPLHILVAASDELYCEELRCDPLKFAEFKKASIPRLKFSSQFDTWLKTGRPIDV